MRPILVLLAVIGLPAALEVVTIVWTIRERRRSG